MAEPEPEQGPTSVINVSAEPEVKFPEPGPEYGVKVEPVPEWSTAVVEWGAAWQVHLYGLGTVFLLTALYGVVSTLRLRRGQKKVHIINFFLSSVFGLSRGLFLVIDGYHYRKILPPIAVKMLWGVGQPCLITAYSLLFLVLKNALVMRQRFKTWYTTKNIAIAALPYFVFVGIAEMTVTFLPSFKVLTFVCQFLYILYTILLLLFYSVVARILWKKKRGVKTGMATGTGRRKAQGSRFQVMLIVCYMAIFGGLLLCVSQLYGMVGVYGVFSDAHSVAPWPWYAFNTTQRILELYMTILLLWILSNNSKESSTESNQNTSSLNERSVMEHHSTADIIVKRQSNHKRDFRHNEAMTELNFPGSTIPDIHS